MTPLKTIARVLLLTFFTAIPGFVLQISAATELAEEPMYFDESSHLAQIKSFLEQNRSELEKFISNTPNIDDFDRFTLREGIIKLFAPINDAQKAYLTYTAHFKFNSKLVLPKPAKDSLNQASANFAQTFYSKYTDIKINFKNLLLNLRAHLVTRPYQTINNNIQNNSIIQASRNASSSDTQLAAIRTAADNITRTINQDISRSQSLFSDTSTRQQVYQIMPIFRSANKVDNDFKALNLEITLYTNNKRKLEQQQQQQQQREQQQRQARSSQVLTNDQLKDLDRSPSPEDSISDQSLKRSNQTPVQRVQFDLPSTLQYYYDVKNFLNRTNPEREGMSESNIRYVNKSRAQLHTITDKIILLLQSMKRIEDNAQFNQMHAQYTNLLENEFRKPYTYFVDNLKAIRTKNAH